MGLNTYNQYGREHSNLFYSSGDFHDDDGDDDDKDHYN